MHPFLSFMHAKAHSWMSELKWGGGNQEGAGTTIGEEVEQVNSFLSRAAICSKYMSKAGVRTWRNSPLSYLNSKKQSSSGCLMFSSGPQMVKASTEKKGLKVAINDHNATVMLLDRLKEEVIVVREVNQHMEYMRSVAGLIEKFTLQLTEDTNGKCSRAELMEKGREGLLCVLKRRLCEVEAQLATAHTTYKSILGLQTLSLDDVSEEEDLENTSSSDEELVE